MNSLGRSACALLIAAVLAACGGGGGSATDPGGGIVGLPPSLNGSISFNVNSDHVDAGGRTEYGDINASLARDAVDPLLYSGSARVNVRVDYQLSGMTCDSIAVPVEMKVDLKFESRSVAARYLLGAVGTYSAQTRCCANGVCQLQDVSSAIGLMTSCNGGDFIGSANPASIFGHARFRCDLIDSFYEEDLSWNFL